MSVEPTKRLVVMNLGAVPLMEMDAWNVVNKNRLISLLVQGHLTRLSLLLLIALATGGKDSEAPGERNYYI